MQANSVTIDNAIPDEVLGKIFRQCPYESLGALRTVSKRWNRVVDTFTGRMLIVKTGNEYQVDSESTLDKLNIKANYWMTLPRERTRSNESLSISNSSTSNEPTNVENVETCLPEISHGKHVHKVGLVGDITLKSMEYFLHQCNNVTSLYLHLSLFNDKEFEDTEKTFSISSLIPFLKELVIDSSGMNTGNSPPTHFSYKRAFNSVFAFLDNNKFSSLNKFIFGLPYFESREGIVVQKLANFLSKHSETLKSFSLHQKYDVQSEKSDSGSEKGTVDKSNRPESGEGDCRGESISPSSSKCSNSDYLSLKYLAVNALELKKCSLEEIHIVLLKTQESSPLWKNLLLHQERMKRVIFAGDKMPCPVSSIECNWATLVTLRLDLRDGVNLACFKKCIHLKNLTLGGRAEAYYEDEFDSDEEENQFDQTLQLRNVNCLPKSLESLEIMNLRTHQDDASIICMELPELRDLHLKNLGWEGNLGLRLGDLVQMWIMGRLDHFCIEASLNMMSYSEIEKSRSVPPELNLMACVLLSNSFTAVSKFYLNVWKNEAGMYTTVETKNIASEITDVFQIPDNVVMKDEEETDDESESEEEEDSEEENSEEEEGSGNEEEGSDDDYEDAEQSESDLDGKEVKAKGGKSH
ncbi:hypothetical protein Ocin01_01214 [Orchesella cincta]|uniref:F-box domain-containing protein n=1 Tax=Orchesella cincta TaxID=48709 RepID=A0A1D2NJK2_ORCCI|nr:hypothetical protein Ocin01_01214 [Orchesella cincta]